MASDSSDSDYEPSSSPPDEQDSPAGFRAPAEAVLEPWEEDELDSTRGSPVRFRDVQYLEQVDKRLLTTAQIKKSRLGKIIRDEPALAAAPTTTAEPPSSPKSTTKLSAPSGSSHTEDMDVDAPEEEEEGQAAFGSIEGLTLAEATKRAEAAETGREKPDEDGKGDDDDDEDGEEDEDDTLAAPSFGAAEQALHDSIQSVQDLNTGFDGKRRRWEGFVVIDKERKSKNRSEPAVFVGEPALPGKNINSVPTFHIQQVVGIRTTCVNDWIKGFEDLFPDMCRHAARAISALASVAANPAEVRAISHDPVFRPYLTAAGDNDSFTTIRAAAQAALKRVRPSLRKPDRPVLVNQAATCILLALETDGAAVRSGRGIPKVADPAGSNKKANELYAYRHVGFGAMQICAKILKDLVTSQPTYIPFRRVRGSGTVTVRDEGDRIRVGLPSGSKNRVTITAVLDQSMPDPPPLSHPPVLTFPYLPTDPPDLAGRLLSYRPKISSDHADILVKMVGWLNAVAENEGIREMPSTDVAAVSKRLRYKFQEQPIPLADTNREKRRVAFSVSNYATRGSTIRVGTLIDRQSGGYRLKAGWCIYDEELALAAAAAGNEAYDQTGDMYYAKRIVGMTLDVGEGTLTEGEGMEMLEHPRLVEGQDEFTCLGCGQVKPPSQFPARDPHQALAFSRIFCAECDPFADPEAFSPRFHSFDSLRISIVKETDTTFEDCTPKSLAQQYDGINSFDLASGVAQDAYTDQSLEMVCKPPHLGSLDCVGGLIIDVDKPMVKHAQLDNVVPTLRTTNFALQDGPRQQAGPILTLAAAVPLLDVLKTCPASELGLTPEQASGTIGGLSLLINTSRSMYSKLKLYGSISELYKGRFKLYESYPKEILGEEPVETHLATARLLDSTVAEFIAPASGRAEPGSERWYRDRYSLYSAAKTSKVKRLHLQLKKEAEAVPMYRTFAAAHLPPSEIDEEEVRRIQKVAAEMENHFGITFRRTTCDLRLPIWIGSDEQKKWETTTGKKLTGRDLLGETEARAVRAIYECDRKYRRHPNAEPLEFYVGNLYLELLLEVALGEDEDIFLGQLQMLAEGHPMGGGIGHRIQGRPMTFGIKNARPWSFKEYVLMQRNFLRRSFELTRHFQTKLQRYEEDTPRQAVMLAYAQALVSFLSEHRYTGLSDSAQDKMAEALQIMLGQEIDLLSLWRRRGILPELKK
ncbi:hypothetical protein JCM10908_001256 [Rhodotorula pacifica]|uniref:uncharacterized protein n=1 Tax=Rhodotorula pacifica TaxID=1495444 RepID=UPI00317D14BC